MRFKKFKKKSLLLWAYFVVQMKILFVCLGNICRSPLAEALFNKHVHQLAPDSEMYAESAGTSGIHVGETPDARTLKNASQHGLEINHRGRQFKASDFETYDKIVVMDESNLQNVLALTNNPQHREKVIKMRHFDTPPSDLDVPDPWYGGSEGFEKVYQILNRATRNLADKILHLP